MKGVVDAMARTKTRKPSVNWRSVNSRLDQIDALMQDVYKGTYRVDASNSTNLQNITDDIVAKITNHIKIVNNQDNTYTAEVYLNINSDLNNENKENNYVKVYTLSYPFIKQGCRFTMEDWTINVYLA